MRFKATEKEIRKQCYFIIPVCYCDLQYLLYYSEPVAYTMGVYGKNADIFDLQPVTGYNACIATGYRPFGNIKTDYSYNREIETQAKKIVSDNTIEYQEKRKMLSAMLEKWAMHYIDEYKKENA